jgi:hypothetical protein
MAAARLAAVIVSIAFLIYLSGMQADIKNALSAVIPEPVAKFFTSNSDVADAAGLEALRSKAANSVRGAVKRPDSRNRPQTAAFSVGDTKHKVRAAHGAPASEMDNVWRYGYVEVYFVNGRVIGWSNLEDNRSDTK